MDITILYIVAGAACIVIFLLVYRSLRAPFFLYLSAALVMACASIITFIVAPEVRALSDLSLALSGASMGAASLQLSYSFGLAGGHHD